MVDAGGKNLPGGEFFTSPVEDSAEGVITFAEFPAVYLGREVRGIRLRFEGGRVVDASAETAEDFLLSTLDTDEGARRLGELGIGCNPAITRHMKNVLFDEKMDGTIHLAVGNTVPGTGGTNESSIHWDIVKDLRSGGRIELDGRVVQQDGVWQLCGVSIWHNRALRALISGQTVSRLGSQMTFLALPWFVLETTGSAARMGVVLAVELAPVGLFGIPSGALVGAPRRAAHTAGSATRRGCR